MSGFGRVNKLILQFDEAFWPLDTEVFILSNGCEDGETMMDTWFSMYPLTNKPVLMAFLGGQDASQSELLSDQQLKDKGSLSHNDNFGNSV